MPMLYHAIFILLCCLGEVTSLRCWQCIADDCDMDPSDNYKAWKKPCRPGQVCQVSTHLQAHIHRQTQDVLKPFV